MDELAHRRPPFRPHPDTAQPAIMKPRSGWLKRPRFGNTVGMSAALTPNHLARVDAYSSTEVVGIQRPSPVSSGPLMTSVGTVPYSRPPTTAPPTTMWWLPHP